MCSLYYTIYFTNLKDLLKVIEAINCGFYETLEQAMFACKKLDILNSVQYGVEKKYRLDPRLPSNLSIYSEWEGWTAFFGRSFLSFKDLKKEVQKEGIKDLKEYQEKQKSKPKWASNPNSTYRKEWVSWYDFLGKTKLEIISFQELKKEVQEAGVKNQRDYRKISKNKPDWVSTPERSYSKEWKNWHDFLGSYLKFSTLKKEVRKAGIQNGSQYAKAKELQRKWPRHPYVFYKKEWTNWYDFLGKTK